MGNFKTVEVIFKNPEHNYKTSVNPQSLDKSLNEYFVNTWFNLGAYPVENMQQCIKINIT